MKRKLSVVHLLSILVIAASCGNKQESNAATQTDTIETPKVKEVTLAFTGDVMMGTNFPQMYVTEDRGRSLFVECDSILRNADVAIVNHEGTCYDGDEGERRKMTNPRTYFIFRTPGDHAQRLVEAGVDAVNMANNHSFDFGMTGRKNTVKTLHDAGLEIAGLRELAEGVVLERRGVKFAYIGFAASCTKVLDMLDRTEVDSMINKYRKLGDILIVSFHGGAEGTAYMHVPMKEEYYVGEDRGNVYEFAHHCIDMGADMVIGHGPHVPRAMELYKDHLIAYSLGNFCTPLRMGIAGATGYAPLLELKVNTSDGTFVSGQIHSYIQKRGLGPRRDTNNIVSECIRKLTLEDFPNTSLKISETGKLSK